MRIELRLLSILFLSFFIFTNVGEAKNTSSVCFSHVQKQKLKVERHKKRKPVTAKKKQDSSVKQAGKTRQKLRTKSFQKPKTIRKKSATQRPTRKLIAKKQQKKSNITTKKKQMFKVVPRKQKVVTVKKKNQTKPTLLPMNYRPMEYFSQLNWYTQRNSRVGKLDQLFSKNHLGQGQTISLIELSGTWDEMQDVMCSKKGNPPSIILENYKRNFLSSIGDPKVDPNAKIDRNYSLPSASSDCHKHGSQVASILMDLAPHAKVLPVSTYQTPSGQSYDIADALMALAKRPDVSVINISSGHYDFNIKSEFIQDNSLITTYSFPPKHIEAFKAVAKAGKVVVWAAGNEGIELRTANDSNFHAAEKYRLFLLENLDEETRKSIIFAGNLDPDTATLRRSSNRPGALKSAQDIFLYAPGEIVLSYNQDKFHSGTSFSAPYICAAIANLCSRSPKITPKQAVRALLEAADKQPDVRTYGRGIINAARALDWLESEILK